MELIVGSTYRAKHSSGFIDVILTNISKTDVFSGRSRTRYECRNLSTGRDITFKSKSHFIREVKGTI